MFDATKVDLSGQDVPPEIAEATTHAAVGC
jgi:hypothetical protein